MTGRQSAAMDKAQKLIEGGMSVKDAAKKTGVVLNGIYRKEWYKALRAAQKDQSK
jgi:hypothetical protein